MEPFYFDDRQRFVIENFATRRPFASFLPGIAGRHGIPMWAFYTNRGQAIAGFGVENRDNPILEFQPANKAYQTTPFTGFRTFIKLHEVLYEPFAPWQRTASSRMSIGMNELELQTTSTAHGLQTNVLYFTLSDEPFAGLARQVTVTNVSDRSMQLELLDGLPWVQPYGVDEASLKLMDRTLEAWKSVFNLTSTEQGLSGVPFYRFQASAGDTAEVAPIRAGHFYLACCESRDGVTTLPPLVDPDVVFGSDTSLHTPQGFLRHSLAKLQASRQITNGKTPSGFFGTTTTLTPGESVKLHAVIGHISGREELEQQQQRIAKPTYLRQQRERANKLSQQLTDVIETQTSEPRFDAYCRQTFLDNVLRGGWPLLLGNKEQPFVYHIYSRKHGDMERDYNDFYLPPEMYSQGNGNYRDVNQNRRSDVFFQPGVDDFNVLNFLSLLQADGYNPLSVLGQQFTLPPAEHSALLELVEKPAPLATALNQPFTPGELLRLIHAQKLGLRVQPAEFIDKLLAQAAAHIKAAFGEGYWIDHWIYNLDMIESYLAIYPDRKEKLLFEKEVPYFHSPAFVQPRSHQYVLTARGVRRYHALQEEEWEAEEKGSRWLHTASGQLYKATVFEKLFALALLKFATLDPWGMGVEMEAGRPGWYDALNGLPGLIGSSLCESYELLRLLDFLLEVLEEENTCVTVLPIEQVELLERVQKAFLTWQDSPATERDSCYWETVATARERYRARVKDSLEGTTKSLDSAKLSKALQAFRYKVQAGLHRAVELNDGTPPTYFTYRVTKYQRRIATDAEGRPYVRPLGVFAPAITALPGRADARTPGSPGYSARPRNPCARPGQ